MQTCERCGKSLDNYELTDYCAECNKNLCDDCMKKGCCGNIPAKSGMENDYPDETEDED